MKKLRIVLALVLAATMVVSALSLLLPRPSDVDVKMYYSPIATSVVLVDVLLALGASVLFLMALRNFKPELKSAYRLLAFSALAVGVFLLMFPYIEYYGLWDNVNWNMASYLQYLIGAPLMYLGIRMFYKRVGGGGWLASIPIIVGLTAALSVVHALLPHIDVWPMFSELQHDSFEIVTVIPVVAYAVSLAMAASVWRRTGQEYKRAFGWIIVGLAFYAYNTIGITTLEIIGYENWYFDNRIYTIPAILGDLSLVFAGYCFSAVGQTMTAKVGWLKRIFGGHTQQPATSVDIVTYAAQLASDQSKIDDYLDDLRMVTAQKHTGESLNSDDQKILRDVYLHVEDYLVSSDALRSFNKQELRASIAQRFGLGKQDKTTFWPMINA